MILFIAIALDLRRRRHDQWSTRAAVGAIHAIKPRSHRLRRAGVRCRFTPTCSHYGEGRDREFGAGPRRWMMARNGSSMWAVDAGRHSCDGFSIRGPEFPRGVRRLLIRSSRGPRAQRLVPNPATFYTSLLGRLKSRILIENISGAACSSPAIADGKFCVGRPSESRVDSFLERPSEAMLQDQAVYAVRACPATLQLGWVTKSSRAAKGIEGRRDASHPIDPSRHKSFT